MNNLYLAYYTKGSKVMTQEAIAEGSRDDAKSRATKQAKKYGWNAKVFPAHYANYGKIKLDHLHKSPVIS